MLMFLYKCLDSDNRNIASERTVIEIKTNAIAGSVTSKKK